MQIQNAAVTGSFSYNGVDISSITSSTSNISALNAITASLLSTTASLNTASGSAITRLNSIESTTGSLNTASGSAITRLNAIEVVTGSNISRLNSIESTTGSLNTASGSAITRLNALEVTSGSNITRISALETASGSAITRLSSLESKTGSYATTGSNTFVNTQYISASNNPTGFTTTASLYTDGGLRVTRDAYISGTLYLNNVTVYGTQSIAYISSSQLNIASNLITVNTATPSVQFGGLAVYDSGSTGLTGSILWDSTNNRWIYSNPSGSSYDGGMLISGPRNSSGLGNEVGTTACALMMGQGGDHITSSAITHYSTATCFYNNTIIGSGGTICTTMANASCIGIGTSSPARPIHACIATGPVMRLQTNGSNAAIEFTPSLGTGNNLYNWLIGAQYNLSNTFEITPSTAINGSTFSTPALVVTSGGNIGIGINSPGYKLDVNASSGDGIQATVNGTVLGLKITQSSVTDAAVIRQQTNGHFYDLRAKSDNSYAIQYDGGDRITITSGGITCFACQVCAPSYIGSNICLLSPYDGSLNKFILSNSSNTINALRYDTLVIQADDVTTLKLVERNAASVDQVFTMSVGDGTARLSTTCGLPMQFFINGNPSACGYNGLSGTAALSISSTGVSCFTYQVCVGAHLALRPTGFGYDANTYKILQIGEQADLRSLAFGVDVSGNLSGAFSGHGCEYVWKNTATFITPNSSNNGYNTVFGWTGGGQSYVKSPSANATAFNIKAYSGNNLVNFTDNGSNGDAVVDLAANSETGVYNSSALRLNANGYSYFNGGNVGINTTSPCSELHVANKVGSSWTTFVTVEEKCGGATEIVFRSGDSTYNRRGALRFYSNQISSTTATWTVGASMSQSSGDNKFWFYNCSNTPVLTLFQDSVAVFANNVCASQFVASNINLTGNYNNSYTICSSGWSNQYVTIIPPNTLGTRNTYVVSVYADNNGAGAPYVAGASFLFTPGNTNGGGIDNEFQPLTSMHQGYSNSYSLWVAARAGSGQVSAGLAIKLCNWATVSGTLSVKASLIQPV